MSDRRGLLGRRDVEILHRRLLFPLTTSARDDLAAWVILSPLFQVDMFVYFTAEHLKREWGMGAIRSLPHPHIPTSSLSPRSREGRVLGRHWELGGE